MAILTHVVPFLAPIQAILGLAYLGLCWCYFDPIMGSKSTILRPRSRPVFTDVGHLFFGEIALERPSPVASEFPSLRHHVCPPPPECSHQWRARFQESAAGKVSHYRRGQHPCYLSSDTLLLPGAGIARLPPRKLSPVEGEVSGAGGILRASWAVGRSC